jgi:predicted porin
MMKKSLAALAVLGAFAGTALAANVTLYGIVDEGLVYTHLDKDLAGTDSTDTLSLDSGVLSGSRWGIKGVEELSGSTKVGFQLESGFDAGDGTSDNGGRLFGRQSTLFVEGAYGHLAAGRAGSLVSGAGSYQIMGNATALGTSYSSYTAQAGNVFSLAGRVDNAIFYKTPKFAGFQLSALYSFRKDNKSTKWDFDDDEAVSLGSEGHSNTDRYAALGLTYANGPFMGFLVGDFTDYSADTEGDDGYTIALGGNYDFGVAKVYLAGQYYDEVRVSTLGSTGIYKSKGRYGLSGLDDDAVSYLWDQVKMKGWSASLSASFPVAGGELAAGFGYVDAESADSFDDAFDDTVTFDLKRYIGTVAYTYPFSKRTTLYTFASYGQDKLEVTGYDDQEPSYAKVGIGLRHKF